MSKDCWVKLNQDIWDLWQQTKHDPPHKIKPLFYQPIEKNSILFIGLNPSFPVKEIIRLLCLNTFKEIYNEELEQRNFDEDWLKGYFSYQNESFCCLDKFIKFSCALDKTAKEKSSYFLKFKDISKYIGCSWDHADLFFVRETSQTKLKQIIFSNEKTLELNQFGKDQLDLSKKLLRQSDPKLIVVANALASRIFKEEFQATFCDDKGCYFVEINNMTIPVFLTSMLTQQRALDIFSYERLKWHIKKIVNKNT